MLDRCKTRYYIQVDGDMVLKPHAIRTMLAGIKRRQEQGQHKTAMVCWPLWDVHLKRTLLGVKAYAHNIFREYPYTDTQSCEMDQLTRLQQDGYNYEVEWGGAWSDHKGKIPRKDRRCLGDHGSSYTPKEAYERYKDLTEKARFVGGSDWVHPWVWTFLERIAPGIKPTDPNLWAFLGCIAGLQTTQVEHARKGEKDFRTYNKMKDYGEQDARLVPDPIRLDVYTTGACNMRCDFCRRQQHGVHRARHNFSAAMAQKVLNIYPSIQSACVAGFGEPLTAPELPQLLNFLISKSKYTSLITNGLAISDKLGVIPWAKLGYVNVSLNEIEAKAHENRCGVPGAFQKAVSGTQQILSRGANAGFSFVISAQNWKRIPHFLRFSKAQGAKFVSMMNVLPHHSFKDKSAVKAFRQSVITNATKDYAKQLPQFKKLAGELNLDVNAWPVPITPGSCPKKCRSPWLALGVDGDGYISGCCRVTPPSKANGMGIARGHEIWRESRYLLNLRRSLAGADAPQQACSLCFGNWVG
jgi:MoaA/NifB/PqqE/SkfB family radical SAM enzyme